jgi:hypothetical protein
MAISFLLLFHHNGIFELGIWENFLGTALSQLLDMK